MPGKSKQTLVLAQRSENVAKLRAIILGGETSREKMAAALHVTPMTIGNYIKLIQKGFGNTPETEKELNRERNLCSVQGSHLFQKAVTAYEISCKQEVETTTVLKEEKCDSCKGTGIKSGTEKEWCVVCEGNSTVKMEVVTQKQRGTAGDPSYLEVARKCLADKVKLLGLAVEKKKEESKGESKSEQHVHFHSDKPNPFANSSNETILELMSGIEKAKRESRENAMDVKVYNKDDAETNQSENEEKEE